MARDDLDEVSDAKMAVIKESREAFAGMTASQIGQYARERCSEYPATDRTKVPISHRQILEALGEPDAAGIASRIAELIGLDRAVRKATTQGSRRPGPTRASPGTHQDPGSGREAIRFARLAGSTPTNLRELSGLRFGLASQGAFDRPSHLRFRSFSNCARYPE